MERLQQLLVKSFDYYAERTLTRLDGLSDHEYLWEPAPGCWSLRHGADGWAADWAHPAPEPAPVTTIAWRLVHIIYCLREHGLRSVAFEGGKAQWVPPSVLPHSADEARQALAEATAVWRRDLLSVDDHRLWEPMGEEAGMYGPDPVVALVEHIHDELIHHAAEVALLRDLYLRLGAP